jgi:hypothetical protein
MTVDSASLTFSSDNEAVPHDFPTPPPDPKRTKITAVGLGALSIRPPEPLPQQPSSQGVSRWSSSTGTRINILPDGTEVIEYESEQDGANPRSQILPLPQSSKIESSLCPQGDKGVAPSQKETSNGASSSSSIKPSSRFIVSIFSPSAANIGGLPIQPLKTDRMATPPGETANSSLNKPVPPQPLKSQEMAAPPKEPTDSLPMGKEAIEKWIKLLQEGDDLDKVANIKRSDQGYEEGFVFNINENNNITKILDRLPARRAYAVSKESLIATEDLKVALEKNPKAKEGFLTWIQTLLFYYDIEFEDLNEISVNEYFDWDVMFEDENPENILRVSRMLNSCVVLGFKDLAVRIFTVLKSAQWSEQEKLKTWEKALEGALEDPEMQKIQSESALLSLMIRVEELEASLKEREMTLKKAGLLEQKEESSEITPADHSQTSGSDPKRLEEQLKLREKEVMKQLKELAKLEVGLCVFEQELHRAGFIDGQTVLDDETAPYILNDFCTRPDLVKEHLDAILDSLPVSSSKNLPSGSRGIEFKKINKSQPGSAQAQKMLNANFNRLFDVLISQYGFQTENRQTVRNQNFHLAFLKDPKNIRGIARLLHAAVLFESKEKAIDFLKALKANVDLEETQVLFLEGVVYSGFDHSCNSQRAWVQFFLGNEEDELGRSLEEILKRGSVYKERCHNYIQRIFQIKETSKSDPLAPLATDELIEAFQAQNSQGAKLRSNLKRCYLSMLDFYGFEEKENGAVEKAGNFNEKSVWLHINSQHNFLRISRILRSLTLLGLKKEAIEFHNTLCSLYSEDRCNDPESPDYIPPKTREFWANAVS